MRIDELVEVYPGVPFRQRLQADPSGKYSVVQARDLGADGRVQLGSAVRQQSLAKPARGGFLQPGDVLVQPRGTRFPVALLDAPGATLAVAAAPLWVLRADKARVVPEFLVAVLISAAAQSILRQAAVGTYVPQVPRDAIEGLRIELPDLPSQMTLVHLARLERRERELVDRLREARGRLFDLAVSETAKKARKRANASGPEPALEGASTPRGPLSTPRERKVT
jgi:hypothetical protein